MKRCGLFFPMALAIVMLAAATGHAALISLYEFDGETTWLDQTIANGGPTGIAGSAASFVSGGINGTGALQLVGGDANANSYVNITGARPLGADMWKGTISYWMNTTDAQINGVAMQQVTTAPSTQVLRLSSWSNPGELWLNIRANTSPFSPSSSGKIIPATTIDIFDGNWHQVTSTWDLLAPDNADRIKFYVDGVPQTLGNETRAITSADVFVDPTKYIIGGELTGAGAAQWCFSGMLDEFAAFGSPLDDAKAAALYNMGKTGSALGVGTADADKLFGLFDDTAHSPVTVKGMTWSYVDSGLGTGLLGEVGSDYVILGAGGAGVQGAGATRLIVNGGTVTKSGSDVTAIVSGPGVDIQAGKLVMNYTGGETSAAEVKTLLTTSYNDAGGKFAGGQFMSTTATASLGLGWKDNTATSEISVALTRYGDASLDGTVNLSDLTLLGQNWNGTGKVWAQADFNYDGAVNLSDLTLLGQNWNQSVPGFPTAGPSAVPEPNTLLLLAAAAVGLGFFSIRRRRLR